MFGNLNQPLHRFSNDKKQNNMCTKNRMCTVLHILKKTSLLLLPLLLLLVIKNMEEANVCIQNKYVNTEL